MINELLSESLAVLDGFHAIAQAAGTVTTAAVDLSKFRQILFIVDMGVAGSSATLDFSLTGSATSGGSYVAITSPSTSITQLTATGKYAVLCVRVDQLVAANPTVAFIKGSAVVAVATSTIAVIVLGALGAQEPQSQFATANLLSTTNV